jgi:hypothetical protein
MAIRNYFFRSFEVLLATLLLFCCCVQGRAADISLAWDPSTSENIAGYKVYIGNSSRTYGTPITIGNQTTYTATSLADGTWYFAVTAFNAEGDESDFSNEVWTTIGASSSACDINGDTSVNVLDLQALANIILELAPPSGSNDLNSDGRVDALDLQILNNVILGLRSCP